MKRSATVLWFFAVLSLVSLMGARILIGEWLNYFWLPFCFFFLFSVLAVAMDFAYLKKSLSILLLCYYLDN